MSCISRVSELTPPLSGLLRDGAKICKGSAASSSTTEDAGVGKEKDCPVAVKVTYTSEYSYYSTEQSVAVIVGAGIKILA